MTLTLDLSPELETRLHDEAARNGMEARDYALKLIERNLTPSEMSRRSLWETLTPEEFSREWDQWADSHRDWPALPIEADSRESMYEDERLR